MKNSDPVNILLVDDQPSKLLGYEVILAELGETLIKASSAREALAELLRRDIAMVLIDVQMPELDGFELAAMIREHPRFQQTALVFVSAIHLSDLDRIKGYEAGAVDYVPVPVVPEVLRAKVRIFADLHRKTRELERFNAELERRIAERTSELEASAAELQKLNEELEHRIEQRTQEREQALAQLFEAQKIDAVGHLTGGIAHDFNNLLTAVMGSLQILSKRLKGDAASQELLDNALKGAERGAALTQRLLAFARRQELRPQRVAIADLVDGMKDLLTRALGPSVRLRREMSPDLPHVLVDANQLELALLNLSINARDSMPNGGEIRLEATPRAADAPGAPPELKPGRYLQLSVVDTGVGMDEAILARAAEPFFTTKGMGRGTGLGLSMVYGLAAQSGGALALSSAVGKGTRVDLWLPIAATTPNETGAASCGARERAAVAGPSRPLKVLVVDDDLLVLRGTAAMLEDLGHVVIEAGSAIEALNRLKEVRSIDLVITDHAMPEMTGAKLALQISKIEPDIRVILATGYASESDDALKLPRLAKPFTQADLARAISECGRFREPLIMPDD